MVLCLFVCLSRTIFGKKKGAHVHLEGWKHGYRDTGLNMVCTQYRLLWLLWGARARAIKALFGFETSE